LIISALFTAAEVIVPLFFEQLPRNVFAVLSGVTAAGALIARVIMQKDLNG